MKGKEENEKMEINTSASQGKPATIQIPSVTVEKGSTVTFEKTDKAHIINLLILESGSQVVVNGYAEVGEIVGNRESITIGPEGEMVVAGESFTAENWQ